MLPEVRTGYSFGHFELRIRGELLLRKGSRVRIERLPLQILLALLAKPGEIITREELCARLWSDQTFLQADKGLQVAVAKLRKALGEQASAPRMIKTAHRIGYQFIGEVAILVEPASPGTVVVDKVSESRGGEAAPLDLEMLDPAPQRSGARSAARSKLPWVLVGIVAAVVAGVGVLMHARQTQGPLAAPGELIALGRITNRGSDRGLDATLSTAIRLDFQESPYVALLAGRSFLDHIKSTDDEHRLQASLAACSSLNAQLLVDGAVETDVQVAQTPSYVIVLNVWRCKDGRALATESASATTIAGILPAMDTVVDKIRKRLGESDESIERFHGLAGQITTNSPAALQAFHLGEEKLDEHQVADAISALRLAINLDPQFALAYARLGTLYYNIHDRSLSQEYSQKAFDLREHTSERERLYIASHYYSFATGEVQQAIQAYALWASLYPYDPMPATNLANEYLAIGEPEKALGPATRAAENETNVDGSAHAAYMLSLLETGQYDRLRAVCNDPARQASRSTVFHFTCLRLAGVEGDQARVQREIDWARANPPAVGVLEFAASLAYKQGHPGEGRALFAEGRTMAMQDREVSSAAELDLDEAEFEAALGLRSDARRQAMEAVKLAPAEPYIQGLAALALAHAGDLATASVEAHLAAINAPLDQILKTAILPAASAAMAMDRGHAKEAVLLLEPARPLDGNLFTALAPAYDRGLALQQQRQFDAAGKEFQWVVAHSALSPDSLFVDLSRLELGRTLQMAGHCDAAMTAIGPLATTWKTAAQDFTPARQLEILKKSCSTTAPQRP